MIMMRSKLIDRYAERVGYNEDEVEAFREGGHRVRVVEHLARAASKYSIVATVTEGCHCNSGHEAGQRLVLDIDGNFITKLCPKRICVYLASQLTIPVALINERISEGLTPNDFSFMRYVRCPDAGVNCLGFGNVTMKVEVVPRIKE